MRKSIIAVAAAALGIAYAAPSHAAAPFSGYYLATFQVPGGKFQHCFQLKHTNVVKGYRISGTWTDTDFPNTYGQFVVFKNVLHFAGVVGDPSETDYLSVDGFLGTGTGAIANATFDYFTPAGTFLAAGNLTEMANPGCKP